jgi:hypothetical protein
LSGGGNFLASKFWLPNSGFCILSGMEIPDLLRELFRMQKALNERIGVQTDCMSEAETTKWGLN